MAVPTTIYHTVMSVSLRKQWGPLGKHRVPGPFPSRNSIVFYPGKYPWLLTIYFSALDRREKGIGIKREYSGRCSAELES